MSSDHHAQLKQIDEHYRALRLDIEAAESAGAALPDILVAKDMLEQAVRIAKYAIINRPELAHGNPESAGRL